MSSKRALVGAGIAVCALLVCIGVILVINTAMADDVHDAASNSEHTQIVSESASFDGSQLALSEEAVADSAAAHVQQDQSGQPQAEGGASGGQNTPGAAGAPAANSRCTISIDCSAALDNADQLSASIRQNLPANGLILAPSQIEIADSATAFDALKNACSMAGIPLDYTGGFLGSQAYVKKIGPIGEFDCGPQSGWTYTINGQMVFASASECRLQPGDTLVWSYTCGL